MKIIYLSLLLGAASAIKVEKVSPSQVKVKQGGSFAVTCTADDWYEVSLIFVKNSPIIKRFIKKYNF